MSMLSHTWLLMGRRGGQSNNFTETMQPFQPKLMNTTIFLAGRSLDLQLTSKSFHLQTSALATATKTYYFCQ